MTKDNKEQKLSDSTDTAIAYSTCYAQPSIQLFNCDNLELMAKMGDESVDVILTDPPYLYLENQKLEREFDEQLFFSECKRLLTKNGFIVLFGRGASFYRWNYMLYELGFIFKEEIVWDKRYSSSPFHTLLRTHETISIFSKKNGVINRSKVPYLNMKKFDFESILGDINRLKSLIGNLESLLAVEKFIKTNQIVYTESTAHKSFTTAQTHKHFADRNVSVINMLINGCVEKSTIIEEVRDHYTAIHPTQKPVRLIERLLALVIPKDKEPNEIVVADFFGGSFSTMEAVYNMQMQGISCEIDEEYFLKGKERIEKLQPIQATMFD